MKKIDLEKYLTELEYLVNQDSGSNYPEGVAKVCDFFDVKYQELNWITKSHNFDKSVGPCLEVKNKDTDVFDFLFVGHMDTVFNVGTAKERPFTIEDNKAKGPGVVDMKSGLLSIYYALKGLEFSENFNPSICVALNSDEEISSRFSSSWIEELAKRSKFAFVLEPARKNGALVLERKGLAKFNIEFTGVAAHAGVEPEKGVSAIRELGYWIMEMTKLTNLEIGTTVNVGVVNGGTKANVVADKASAEIDLRFKLIEEYEKIVDKMDELIKAPYVGGIKTDVKRLGYRPPMNPSDDTVELCRVVEKVGEELGINIEWAATGGGSDANFMAAVGTPTLDGMGPIGGGTHGVSEYLEVDSIVPRINLLRRSVEELYKARS